jgi:Aminotransferase class-III
MNFCPVLLFFDVFPDSAIQTINCVTSRQSCPRYYLKKIVIILVMRSFLQNLMPGGVSSPVRAFKSVGGEPIVFEKVKGAYAWDVDGNKYIDYVCTWGPSIVGHANDEVLDALRETLVKGKVIQN